jgi:hypothetical protein
MISNAHCAHGTGHEAEAFVQAIQGMDLPLADREALPGGNATRLLSREARAAP